MIIDLIVMSIFIYSSVSNYKKNNSCDVLINCLLYTSDAADERSSVDLGGRRIIKKKKNRNIGEASTLVNTVSREHKG